MATKPKRKRRTKVQMERARKKAAKEQAEKDFVIPKSTQKCYDRPQPSKNPVKVVSKYPKPKPLPKFDVSLIDEEITLPGGAKYGITIKTKVGRHVLSYYDHAKDWKILYDARYNDNEKNWNFFVKLKDRLEEEKLNDRSENKKSRKSNRNASGGSKVKSSSTGKTNKSTVRKGRRKSARNVLHNKHRTSAMA